MNDAGRILLTGYHCAGVACAVYIVCRDAPALISRLRNMDLENLNAFEIEAAMKIVEGTARSMGVSVG